VRAAEPGDRNAIRRIDSGLGRIPRRHVTPWLPCNMWLAHGRDRDVLLDSAMGPRPLRAAIAALREPPVDTIHAGHQASFGRDRLPALIDSRLAGGRRLADPEAWIAQLPA
jgi:hypothetical protein